MIYIYRKFSFYNVVKGAANALCERWERK